MKYISTRGKAKAVGFEEVLLTGLAPDGGLYVPEELPVFDAQAIRQMSQMDYTQLAERIVSPFLDGWMPAKDLRQLINDSYAGFRHPAVAPMVQLSANEWVLELFHGPTLAFKDFALQMLGRLLDYSLSQSGERIAIKGATSGDTGSAAIEGCRRCENADIFILHPYQRVSEVQRRQMTTVLSDNVHNIAVRGNFDDCQEMVKASFADQDFLSGSRRLVAVNSINWARIMAQIVYYFYAATRIGSPDREVSFSVPTGNFGDIYAGYLAKKMGLPVDRLIVATNANDILHRFISDNHYARSALLHTLSPSMDIVISSNFERALFDFYGRDGDAISQLMSNFKDQDVTVPDAVFARARDHFYSYSVDDKLTCKTIASVYNEAEYLLDPHSAIGFQAGRQYVGQLDSPVITLATAHPAKFPDAISEAGVGVEPQLPHYMSDLFEREERYQVLAHDLTAVQQAISSTLGS